jgi:HEAT repeat protein
MRFRLSSAGDIGSRVSAFRTSISCGVIGGQAPTELFGRSSAPLLINDRQYHTALDMDSRPEISSFRDGRNFCWAFRADQNKFNASDLAASARAAQAGLGRFREIKETVMLLWKKILLRYAGRETKVRTIQELGRTKDRRAVDLLLPFVHSRYSGCAAEALGEIGDPRAVEPLLTALRSGEIASAAALGKIGDARAIGPLVAALASTYEGLRTASKMSLDQINPQWRELDDARKIFPELAAKRTSRSLSDRYAAGDAMRDVDPHWEKTGTFKVAVPILLEALQSTYSDIRYNAAELLGYIKDNRAIVGLVEVALFDKEHIVNRAADDALNLIDPNWRKSDMAQAMVPRLVNLLYDEKFLVRGSAASRLDEIDPCWRELSATQAIARRLTDSLRDENLDKRLAAASALTAMRDPNVVEVLMDLVQNGIGGQRWLAAVELGTIGDRRAIGTLFVALAEGSDYIRVNAASALDKIDPNWPTSEAAIAAVPRLLDVLKDHYGAAGAAAAALGNPYLRRFINAIRGLPAGAMTNGISEGLDELLQLGTLPVSSKRSDAGSPSTRSGPFERFDTKSALEAIDTLFDQAVPVLPTLTPEEIQRICREHLKYDLRSGQRHVDGSADHLKPILKWNLEKAPDQLYSGQRIIGFQVSIQADLKFAALTIFVGDAQGSPSYAFGARLWKSPDRFVVQGWEGFYVSPTLSLK